MQYKFFNNKIPYSLAKCLRCFLWGKRRYIYDFSIKVSTIQYNSLTLTWSHEDQLLMRIGRLGNLWFRKIVNRLTFKSVVLSSNLFPNRKCTETLNSFFSIVVQIIKVIKYFDRVSLVLLEQYSIVQYLSNSFWETQLQSLVKIRYEQGKKIDEL